jgi:hypothetical protein
MHLSGLDFHRACGAHLTGSRKSAELRDGMYRSAQEVQMARAVNSFVALHN